MRPLKLTLPGRYWDSVIYGGILYLFDLSGGMRLVNWTHLIDAVASRQAHPELYLYAFRQAREAYERFHPESRSAAGQSW